MATVNILLMDTEEEGGVTFRVEFDPPIKGDEEYLSHAQAEAAFLIEIMRRRTEGQTLVQMASEIDEDEYGEVVVDSADAFVEYVDPEDPN